jgi:hypothetical protein
VEVFGACKEPSKVIFTIGVPDAWSLAVSPRTGEVYSVDNGIIKVIRVRPLGDLGLTSPQRPPIMLV